MQKVFLRPATEADIEILLTLLKRQTACEPSFPIEGDVEERLRFLLQQPNVQTALAFINDVPQGVMLAVLRNNRFDVKMFATLPNAPLVVPKAIVRYAVAVAQAHDVKEVIMVADVENTRRSFRRIGFEPVGTINVAKVEDVQKWVEMARSPQAREQ